MHTTTTGQVRDLNTGVSQREWRRRRPGKQEVQSERHEAVFRKRSSCGAVVRPRHRYTRRRSPGDVMVLHWGHSFFAPCEHTTQISVANRNCKRLHVKSFPLHDIVLEFKSLDSWRIQEANVSNDILASEGISNEGTLYVVYCTGTVITVQR